jgi:branched-chain amino acid transport system permease protein
VKWFTNYTSSGSVTAPELNFFGFYANKPIEKYLVCLAFVTLFALMAKNLVRGNIGRQWMAIRDMDIAAELMGIRPLYAKLSAFAVSSFIIGVAGALWAFIYLGSWEPLAFNIDRSFQLCSWSSSAAWARSSARSSARPSSWCCRSCSIRCRMRSVSDLGRDRVALVFVVEGALICWLLIVEPHGFARLWSTGKEKLRLWPYPY